MNKFINVNRNEGKSDSMRILFLGGVGEFGKNLTVYEYKDEIVLVDCGMKVVDNTAFGVSTIVPNILYLKNNISKIKGLILTHAHDDHIGGVAFFLKELNMFNIPIYGLSFTLTVLYTKLMQEKIKDTNLIIKNYGEQFKVGNYFFIEPIYVNHSIAGAMAVYISVSKYKFLHTGDFRIDYSPVCKKTTDLHRIAEISKYGITALLDECTRIDQEGVTKSEYMVAENMRMLFAQYKNKRFIITAISSNIYLVQIIVNICKEYNRKIGFVGRSLINNIKCAIKTEDLKIDKEIILNVGIYEHSNKNVVFFVTGSQGEELSILSKLALGEHSLIKIDHDDIVIFMASIIPGNERAVHSIIDNIFRFNAKVIYQEDRVYTGGHAKKEEHKLLMFLSKPLHLIPIHGDYRQQVICAETGEEIGISKSNIHIPFLGSAIIFKGETCVLKHGAVRTGEVLLDENDNKIENKNILLERKLLAENGLIILSILVNKRGVRINTIFRGILIQSKALIETYKVAIRNKIYELLGVNANTSTEKNEKNLFNFILNSEIINNISLVLKREGPILMQKMVNIKPVVIPIILYF